MLPAAATRSQDLHGDLQRRDGLLRAAATRSQDFAAISCSPIRILQSALRSSAASGSRPAGAAMQRTAKPPSPHQAPASGATASPVRHTRQQPARLLPCTAPLAAQLSAASFVPPGNRWGSPRVSFVSRQLCVANPAGGRPARQLSVPVCAARFPVSSIQPAQRWPICFVVQR